MSENEDWEEKKKREIKKFQSEEGVSDGKQEHEIELRKVPEGSHVHVHIPEKHEGAEEEAQDLKAKLTLLAEKRFREKKKKLGTPDSITTIEELMEFEKNPKKFGGEKKGGAGVAPISAMGGSSKDELEFESYDELVTFLRDIERKEGKNTRKGREASKVLDAIFLKTQKGLMKKGVRPQGWQVEVPSKETREAYGTDSIIQIMKEQLREDFLKGRISRKKRKKELEEEV